MTSHYALPASPQSIGRVLDAGLRLFAASFASALPLCLINQMMFVTPQALGILRTGNAGSIVGSVPIDVALVVGLALASGGPYMGAFLRCWAVAEGRDLEIGAAIGGGYRLLPPTLLASVLFALVCMLGFILLIVPGIYAAGALSLFLTALVAENCGAVASLKRSRALVQGHWWRSATVLSVPLVLVLALLLTVQFVPMFVVGLRDPAAVQSAGMQLAMLASGFVITALTTPLSMCVSIALFHDLRLRLGGEDLEQRLAGLAARA